LHPSLRPDPILPFILPLRHELLLLRQQNQRLLRDVDLNVDLLRRKPKNATSTMRGLNFGEEVYACPALLDCFSSEPAPNLFRDSLQV